MQKPSNQISNPFTNFDNIYQIWYNEETRKKSFNGFQPICNSELTPFFENEIIRNLPVNASAHSWVGVLSPKFFDKVFKPIDGLSGPKLDEFLSKTDKDVVGFHIRMTQRNIIAQAEHYHKGFTKAFNLILERAGIDYDIRRASRKLFTLPSGHYVYANVMSNYVIAKKWVFDRYRDEVLRPCMEVMEDKSFAELQDLIWQDSGYHKLNPRAAKRQYLQTQIGVPFYPYHTFICERFWTMFMNMNTDISMTHYPIL